jgi:MSHA biogenesis protein MshP
MKHNQQGFAMVAAIILVVLLAGLSAFVTSMVSGQSANQNLERVSRVTELAARAGLEWGGYRVMRPAVAPACPAGSTIAPGVAVPMPAGSLSAVTVRVFCSQTNTTESGPVSIYQIASTATYGIISSPDYVERVKTSVFSR